LSGSVSGWGALQPGWQQFRLQECQIMPSASKKQDFKLLVNEEQKAQKEQRFIAADLCSRNVWVKKLLQAKNQSFENNDCNSVPMEEII